MSSLAANGAVRGLRMDAKEVPARPRPDIIEARHTEKSLRVNRFDTTGISSKR